MSIGEVVRDKSYSKGKKRRNKMELWVLRILYEHGPLCGEEVMKIMGTSNPNNARPRLSTMAKPIDGRVAEVGTTLNSDGRPETVYEITDIGKAVLDAANIEDGGTENNTAITIPQEGGNVNAGTS